MRITSQPAAAVVTRAAARYAVPMPAALPSAAESPTTAAWSVSCLAAGLATALGWHAARAQGGQVYDDAMITARYARNLIEGQGWTYNPLVDEAVNASTSPLGTLLHAGAALLTGGDIAVAQMLVGTAAIGVAALAASRLAAAAGRVAAVIAALAMAAVPLLYATLGLESAVFIAGTLCSCAAYARNHRDAGAVALGLTALARPDGLLLAALLVATAMRGDLRALGTRAAVRRSARAVLLIALTLTPWLLFAQLHFGAIAPHTLAAKLAQGRSGWWGSGDRLFWRGIKHSLALFDARELGVGYKTMLAVLAVGTAAAAWRVRPLLPPITFAALHTAAYAALGVPYYPWYAAPLHAATALAGAAAVIAMWQAPRGRLPLRGLAMLSTLAGLFLTWPRPRDATTLYPHYAAAAAWLRANTPSTARIACAEIGVLGFGIGDRTVIDMCGLVTPDGLAAIARGQLDWWLDAHAPDYIVVHDPPWPGFEAPALAPPEFMVRYALAERIDSGESLHIYRLR